MELQNLGSVVAKLEAELGDVRGEIEQQRRDYETLLNNKQRLEQEIGMYHGILDGEERRFQPVETTWVLPDLLDFFFFFFFYRTGSFGWAH